MNDDPTVPCRICKTPTRYLGTKECDPCHEVLIRINKFLDAPKARNLVMRIIHEKVPK